MSTTTVGLPDRPPSTSPSSPWPIAPLWEAADPTSPGVETRGGILPDELAARHAAPLSIRLRADRPTLVANFVSTLDGVVALDRHGGSGGREISGGFEPDRFLMGLLRSTADAVLVGAGTVRASGSRGWTPAHVHRPSADGFARWRVELGLEPTPATIIVTASGRLEPDALPSDPATPVIVATTSAGARRLAARPRPAHIRIADLGDHDSIPAAALVDDLAARGYRLVVTEGGPHLFARLVAAGCVDELFLTLAPQLVGRSPEATRLSLVDGLALPPAVRWGRPLRIMRAADHLFLRYQLSTPEREDLP